jgi:uncharacterized protein (TIGR04255 family)
VRFPPSDRLSNDLPEAFRTHFRERFPVVEPVSQLAISLGFPGAGPATVPQQITLHRMLQRDRLMSLTVARDNVVLETTDYPGWGAFSAVLVEVIDELAGTAEPDGVLRIGLRYVDEIRLPDPPSTPRGWTGSIDSRLLAPLTLIEDVEPNESNITLQYGVAPGYVTVFRASPFASGRSVNPDGPLRQPVDYPDGPYFLLDTDASWADPARQVPPFTREVIAPVFETLHTRCHDLFEASIEPNLRTLLRRDRAEVWGSQ